MRIQTQILFVLCLVLASGCVAPPAAAPPTPTPPPPTSTPIPPSPTAALPAVLKAYEDAYNRHDADAVLALLADEALVFIDTDDFSGYDKENVRGYLEFHFGVGAVVGFEDCSGQEDVWRCTQTYRDNCAGAFPGLPVWHMSLEARLQDGKIQKFVTTDASAEKQLADEWMPKLLAWVQANRPDDWKILSNPDTPQQKVGELWTEVCKLYIATLK